MSNETKAYSRGYAAGRKRLTRDISYDRLQKSRIAFRDRAFLAALPFAFQQDSWTQNGKPIKSVAERVALAWTIANEAVKHK
jgi:hypothetical protein